MDRRCVDYRACPLESVFGHLCLFQRMVHRPLASIPVRCARLLLISAALDRGPSPVVGAMRSSCLHRSPAHRFCLLLLFLAVFDRCARMGLVMLVGVGGWFYCGGDLESVCSTRSAPLFVLLIDACSPRPLLCVLNRFVSVVVAWWCAQR